MKVNPPDDYQLRDQKCFILNVKGAYLLEITLLGNIDETIITQVSPEYWTMSKSTIEILLITLFLYIIVIISISDVKGHFKPKEKFNTKDAEEYEAALNMLIFQELGSDSYF